MADDTAMLTIEPDEPVVHNVRLQQAYRTTVTLRNNTRNAMELTIRAGVARALGGGAVDGVPRGWAYDARGPTR